MAQTKIFSGVKTTVRTDEKGCIVGRYHNTDVCKFDPQTRLLTLNSGGYQTTTTKRRMNQFAQQFCSSRFSVHQKSFAWIVTINGREYEFRDGFEMHV